MDGRSVGCFVGTEEREPFIHLMTGIGSGVDTFGPEDLEDMAGTPAVFVGMHPFEVIQCEVGDISVLVVSFRAFTVGIDGSWSSKREEDDEMTRHIPVVPHGGVQVTPFAIVALASGNAHGGREVVEDLMESASGQ